MELIYQKVKSMYSKIIVCCSYDRRFKDERKARMQNSDQDGRVQWLVLDANLNVRPTFKHCGIETKFCRLKQGSLLVR